MDRVYCLSGWEKLYQPIIQACEAAGVEIRQISEKFAGLYIEVQDGAPLRIVHAIRNARAQSLTVCEVCGYPGEPHAPRGRPPKTLCDPHAVQYATRGLDERAD